MDIDYISACNEYLREVNINGFQVFPGMEEEIESFGLRNKGQARIKTELYEFIKDSQCPELVAVAVQALGWSFDEKYIPFYESIMRANLDDDCICHSCLIALSNINPIGFGLSILEGSKNARKYFGLP